MDRPEVFISYARVDWEDLTARTILMDAIAALETHTRAKLGDRGCSFWRDDQLRWGDNWRSELHRVITDCDLFIIMVSPGWLKSDVCREEYAAMRTRETELCATERILVIILHAIEQADNSLTTGHRALHADLRERQFRDWTDLPVISSQNRTKEIRTSGDALAFRVRTIRNGESLSGKPSQTSLTSPLTPAARNAPTHVSDVPVVSGNYYIPRQDQSHSVTAENPPLFTVALQLAFSGLAKITTLKGTIVFSVRQALLHSTVAGGRIANTPRAFPEGWQGQRSEVTRISPGAVREILRLRAEAGLDGEVLAERGDAGHVRLFDVEPNQETVTVSGYVKVDFEAVHIRLDQSVLHRRPPDAFEKRRRVEAELAKLVLEECGGDTFPLEGYTHE